MKAMRKTGILILAAFAMTACLKDYQDTSFVPQAAVISWSETSRTVEKDPTTFEVTLHSNLPWRAYSTASWLSVSPQRGEGDAVLTIKVAKNRTVEQRTGMIRVVVTEDQFSEFQVTQENSEGGDNNTYYVRTDGSAEASGLSWENATTLASAIDQAADGDMIYVAAGTYSPTVLLENADEGDTSSKTFQIHSNFLLQGGFPADADDGSFDAEADYDPSSNVTVLSGDIDESFKAYHVVTVTAANIEGKKAVLKGFTITGGLSHTEDESILVSGVSYSKGYGAGLVVGPSVLDVEDCIISGNVAGLHAAGVYLKARAEVRMENCRIISNESKTNAGGIWNCGATLYMNNCTVSSNISAQQAAGFYSINSDGVPSISRIYNSTFSDNDCTTVNEGRSGGAGYIREWSDAVFVNCTFTGNKAGNGGALQGYGANGKNSKLTLIGCTIKGNYAKLLGGGVSLWNNYNTTNIYNCIISGNECAAGANTDIGYGSAIGSNTPNLFYETTIVGTGLFSSTGTAVSGWAFDPATMLSAFGSWGGKTETFSLVEGDANPACSQGMTKAALVAIGAGFSPVVEASVFDTDQRGVERSANTIGSTTL